VVIVRLAAFFALLIALAAFAPSVVLLLIILAP
jgi:hypothetical protein